MFNAPPSVRPMQVFLSALYDPNLEASCAIAMSVVLSLDCGTEYSCIEQDSSDRFKIDSTPLMLAVSANRSDIVRALLAEGADVKATKSSGATALHEAAKDGDAVSVNLLIAHGSLDERIYGDEETALHYAAMAGNVNALRALVAHGANIEVANSGGDTPLHLASLYGKKMLEVLLSNGAHIEAANEDGTTPLHYTSGNGDVDTVETLMAHGANIEGVDSHSRSPLHFLSSMTIGMAQRVTQVQGKPPCISLQVTERRKRPKHYLSQVPMLRQSIRKTKRLWR